MAGSNGKAPQQHLTAKELIAAAKARRLKRFTSHGLAIDVLIRPRTVAEVAEVVQLEMQFAAAKEEYKGTVDEPTQMEQLRAKVNAALPCILWPDDQTPVFAADDIDTLLELNTPDLMELCDEVDRASNLTTKQAEEAEKNSGGTGDASSSSNSPSAAEMSASSPTPIR